MPDMDFPDPYQWITREGAAEVLDVNVRTVARMVKDGRMEGYQPRAGSDERPPTLLWYPEVLEMRTARMRAGVQRSG